MKTRRNIFIAFILNLLFSIFELFGGFFTGSVAITSDAIHDFGDAVSIGVAYFFERLSDRKPNKKYTFGYARFSVLGGLITAFILLIGSSIVIYNAILRIMSPSTIDCNGMLIFAIIGLIINLVATYYTHGGKSINQKVVNLHMLEDVLGWLIVLIGSIIIKFTNLYIIDPILSILVALFIFVSAIKSLKQILDIFLIKTPKNINIDEVINHLKNIEGVEDAYHIHVWTINGEVNCATLHLVISNFNIKIKEKAKEELKKHGITHVTIELETTIEECIEKNCNISTHSRHCHHHVCTK